MSTLRPAPAAAPQPTSIPEADQAKIATSSPQPLPVPKTALPSNPDWGAPAFVWGTWAILLLAALLFVANFGSNIPFAEDWMMVPEVTGEQSLTVASLWAPYLEHRIPLAKLVYVSVLKLTAGSLRMGMVLNVLVMSTMALALLLTARSLRGGRTSYADAFFPLALLNWGNCLNILWWWQINFILAMALVVALLVIVLRARSQLTIQAALLAGACLILLPLNGPMSLAFVPALAFWLAYAGWLRWRSRELHGRRDGLLIWCMVAVALVLVPLYFLGLKQHLAPPGLWAVLRSLVQFLAIGLGPGAVPFWQYYGLGVLGSLFLSGVLLLWAWYKRPQERLRTLGLLSFLGGTGCLVLGLAWGRAGFGWGTTLSPHYVVIALPALYCVYFAWGACYPSKSGRLVQMCLLLLACSVCSLNFQEGLDLARSNQRESFERKLRAGAPTIVLAQHYLGTIETWRTYDDFDSLCDLFADYMRMMHRAGITPFQGLQDAPPPPLREVQVPVEPVATNEMIWQKDGSARGTGKDPSLVFALKKPQFVYGIRFKCSYQQPTESASLRVFWRTGERSDFTAEKAFSRPIKRTVEEQTLTVTVWVYDTIDQFRVHPANQSGVFTISEMVLLLSAIDSSSVTRP